ncbi:MAG: hypothetical protein SFT94_12785 [Pseudanabaenaceae cyanobacterium bins.68]|nr:hypothetical protein [Pseudanabaenaceae cyanobacterium bins.68]
MTEINCKEACVNGCILGDRCPNLKYLAEARKFIETTSMDQMLQIAADRFNPPEQN